MPFNTFRKRVSAGGALAVLVTIPFLNGCGGGGGSTPVVVPVAKVVPVSGTLASTTGGGLGGYAVVFDRGSTPFVGSSTSGTGTFTVSVPLTSITGNDTLSFFDSSGALILVLPVTLSNTSTTPVSVQTVTVGPPPPPGL